MLMHKHTWVRPAKASVQSRRMQGQSAGTTCSLRVASAVLSAEAMALVSFERKQKLRLCAVRCFYALSFYWPVPLVEAAGDCVKL